MNTRNEQFERDFEAFLSGGDTSLDALYHKLPQTEPDARVDNAVRAMARRASSVTPRPSYAHRRWIPAIGIAAVLTLAAGIGLRLAPQLWQRPVASLPAEPAPASAPAPAPPAPAAVAPIAQDKAEGFSAQSEAAMPAAAARREAESPRALEATRQRASSPAPTPMPQAFPPPAAKVPARDSQLMQAPAAAARIAAPAPATPAAESAAAESARPETAGAIAKPAAQEAAKALSAPSAAMHKQSADANESLYPEHWLANIRQMLHEHRRAEALRSLENFRKKYPDYRLPDDLRDLR
jgi:hypothetical protein